MLEITITKKNIRTFLKYLITFFVFYTLSMYFSEFNEEKKLINRIIKKEKEEYINSYRFQKQQYENCLEYCKNNPPSMRPKKFNDYLAEGLIPPLNHDLAEELQYELKKPCECADEDYIGNVYIVPQRRRTFIYKPSTKPRYYNSHTDFYVSKIEITPLIGLSYVKFYNDESFNWRDYIDKNNSWNLLARLKFYIICLLKNIFIPILFSCIIFIIKITFFYIKNKVNINIK